MNARKPTYKLVTINGQKPDVNGDRAQATVVEHLQLVENCKRDPSLIVVDVGAFLGNHNHQDITRLFTCYSITFF